MEATQIPQLRIAVTFPCGKACIYCRPGGEAVPTQPKREMSREEIILLTSLLVEHGIRNIKLTGGDPVLRDDIVEIVRDLKQLEGVRSVDLVTRHVQAARYIEGFASAGLDLLNFSLDSLNAETWARITRVQQGHAELLSTIKLAAKSGLKVRINTVIMKGINDHEVNQLIEFAGQLKCAIKFLDLIIDIPAFPKVSQNFGLDHYFDLDTLLPGLTKTALAFDTLFQPGGLGHPMMSFIMPNGASVIIKSSHAGAWYSPVCSNCRYFPCHDALMALRLTSDGKMQFCLLREDNLVDLLILLRSNTATEEIDRIIERALDTYRKARFFSREEVIETRARWFRTNQLSPGTGAG